MALNTEDEHLENRVTIQWDHPPEEIIPINDTETVVSNQETKNMEVNYHAHHGHGN